MTTDCIRTVTQNGIVQKTWHIVCEDLCELFELTDMHVVCGHLSERDQTMMLIEFARYQKALLHPVLELVTDNYRLTSYAIITHDLNPN